MRGSLCGGAGQGAQNLDFGERVSHDPLDHLNSNSMVLWARNPVSTNISLVSIARDVRKRGGRVIVVDPACTRSVALADHHIMPRPGGDGYLAMAATKLILQAGAGDSEFVTRHAVGFRGLPRHPGQVRRGRAVRQGRGSGVGRGAAGGNAHGAKAHRHSAGLGAAPL